VSSIFKTQGLSAPCSCGDLADDWLTKPLRGSALATSLARVLDSA
jgi:hypothetical protein